MVHRSRRIACADGGEQRFTCVEGDLARDDLGWDAGRTTAMLDHDIVVHCAADTALAGGEGQRDLNVGGTRRLLRWLARSARPPALVHVSTAYVCGARSGPIEEVAAMPADTFNNGYEASKAEAEALVAASGLPHAIARPSIVVGRWRDGAISRFDGFYNLLRLAGDGRLRELPGEPDATLDLVPIDHVAGGLVDIVERFEAASGGIVHLASGDPVPVAALCSLAVPGFRAPRLVPPEAGGRRGDLLGPFAAYLRQDPRFAVANLAALSGRRCPPTDTAFLHRLVEGACRAGAMRPDPALLALT